MKLFKRLPMKRGSALLIVLGLLSFLMISAVAFSISMSTEYAAANSYRTNVRARDLLEAAFADARATVDEVLQAQLEGADPAQNPSERTCERLAPFRDGDYYARVLCSYPNDSGDMQNVATLLDANIMDHVPPYVARKVYDILEPSVTGGTATLSSAGSVGYAFDTFAGWKKIRAAIPKATVTTTTEDTSLGESLETVDVGRMAWAVVNLSDSIDINGIGSFAPYRGLGLTGNEFAFGVPAGSTPTVEGYDLIAAAAQPNEALSTELPLFFSNADIARYAARVNGSALILDGPDSIFNYAWQDAAFNVDDGYYSPFSVYSFWPNEKRRTEAGDRLTASTESEETVTLACADLTPTTVLSQKDKFEQLLTGIGVSATVADNLTRLLVDYLDEDCTPNAADARSGGDDQANNRPTVENIPMIAEVGYFADDVDSALEKPIQDTVTELEGFSHTASLTEDELLEDKWKTYPEEVELDLSDLGDALKLSAATYFPGYETASDDAKGAQVNADGYVAVSAFVTKDTDGGEEIYSEIVSEKASVSESLTDISGDMVYTERSGRKDFATSGSLDKIKIASAKLPVSLDGPEGLKSDEGSFYITLLADYFFRTSVNAGGGTMADLAPTDGAPAPENFDITRVASRLNANTMREYDSHYFRVSRALRCKFTLKWKITEDGTPVPGEAPRYKVALEVEDGRIEKLEGSEGDATFTVAGGAKLYGDTVTSKESCFTATPKAGVWKTIDPRYNWLPPMMGSTGSWSDHFDVRVEYPHLTSPHWVFFADTTTANSLLEAYSSKRESDANGVMPFSLGLTWETVRYGYNDSTRMYIPSELGFLPLPLSDDQWTPNTSRNYNQMNVSDYYRSVGHSSYFRTLPMVDFEDGALAGTVWGDYDKATKACTMLQPFSPAGFPEEHRALAYAFAAQDDFALAQRLRQFALRGIPSSIPQAIQITRERLKVAKDAGRFGMNVEEFFPSAGEAAFTPEPSKFDEFVCETLFPVPETTTEGDGWTEGARPKTVNFLTEALQNSADGESLSSRIRTHNASVASDPDKLIGQNDLTTLLSVASTSFGDRQQLFLYILRAEVIAFRAVASQNTPSATARAVALVWRDAYGVLPDRVVYYQVLP